jgi:hypothetical protein
MAKAILVEENIKVGEKILVELDKIIPDINVLFGFSLKKLKNGNLFVLHF